MACSGVGRQRQRGVARQECRIEEGWRRRLEAVERVGEGQGELGDGPSEVLLLLRRRLHVCLWCIVFCGGHSEKESDLRRGFWEALAFMPYHLTDNPRWPTHAYNPAVPCQMPKKLACSSQFWSISSSQKRL